MSLGAHDICAGNNERNACHNIEHHHHLHCGPLPQPSPPITSEHPHHLRSAPLALVQCALATGKSSHSLHKAPTHIKIIAPQRAIRPILQTTLSHHSWDSAKPSQAGPGPQSVRLRVSDVHRKQATTIGR